MCLCDCGNTHNGLGSNLRRLRILSCGCGTHELISKARTKHGYARQGQPRCPEYKTWKTMIARCYIESQTSYKNYGHKGITVCDRWRHSFTNFLEDMGPRPFPKATLDRKDNSGHYTPDNCRWADMKTQQRNRSNNRIIEHNGQRLTTVAWAEITGIQRQTIVRRLTLGWSVAKTLSTPTRHINRIRRRRNSA